MYEKKKRKKLVGRHPCAVVFTHAADGWWREKERKKRKRADARTAATKDDDTDFLLEAKFFSVFFLCTRRAKSRQVSNDDSRRKCLPLLLPAPSHHGVSICYTVWHLFLTWCAWCDCFFITFRASYRYLFIYILRSLARALTHLCPLLLIITPMACAIGCRTRSAANCTTDGTQDNKWWTDHHQLTTTAAQVRAPVSTASTADVRLQLSPALAAAAAATAAAVPSTGAIHSASTVTSNIYIVKHILPLAISFFKQFKKKKNKKTKKKGGRSWEKSQRNANYFYFIPLLFFFFFTCIPQLFFKQNKDCFCACFACWVAVNIF